MAKHFENGGCGIRPFIDLWILDRNFEADTLGRDELLRAGGLSQFADVLRKMNLCWIENEEYDEVSYQMQEYILYGGAYGTSENRVAIQQKKHGASQNLI
jgi:hypothetical protein